MFNLKKNKQFYYEAKYSKQSNQQNIHFKKKHTKSKSRLIIYLIMLILIFGLLFYLKAYIQD